MLKTNAPRSFSLKKTGVIFLLLFSYSFPAYSLELHDFAKLGDTQSLKNLLESGVPVDTRDKDGATPLHWAAHEDQLEAVQLLIYYGADIVARDNDGDTPLHWAAANNSLNTAKFLIANGAPVNIKNTYKSFTPLDFARIKGYQEMVYLLSKSMESTIGSENQPEENLSQDSNDINKNNKNDFSKNNIPETFPYKFSSGPKTVNLEGKIGTIFLSDNMVFLNRKESQKYYQDIGEPIEPDLIGVIFGSLDEENFWQTEVYYLQVGYVKDDEFESISPKNLLKLIKKNTEKNNIQLTKRGEESVSVVGWHISPTYNDLNHTLIYSIIGSTFSNKFINYRTIVLGREGILTVNLILDYKYIELANNLSKILSENIAFKKGRDYQSWVKGDKVSDITMTGLITGGAAATAVAVAKTGFLKKIGLFIVPLLAVSKKLIFILLIPIAALFKAIERIFHGRNKAE